MTLRGFGWRVAQWSGTIGLVLFIWGSAAAAPAVRGSEAVAWPKRVDRRGEMARIVSVLERTLGGQPLPDKAREKLLGLTDGDLQVIAALAERAASAPATVSADLAVLTIAALLVLL